MNEDLLSVWKAGNVVYADLKQGPGSANPFTISGAKCTEIVGADKAACSVTHTLYVQRFSHVCKGLGVQGGSRHLIPDLVAVPLALGIVPRVEPRVRFICGQHRDGIGQKRVDTVHEGAHGQRRVGLKRNHLPVCVNTCIGTPRGPGADDLSC